MKDVQCILELKSIVKDFPGVRALDGVSISIRPGSVHVICGENGAGKSVMMKIIDGMYCPDEGKLYFKGKEICGHTINESRKMGIAMIPQELNPIWEMTVAENIFLGREPKSGLFVNFKKMNADANTLLQQLNIPYKATQKMKELSIAGQQLIEIAKAISMSAELIIMDEPTSAIADHEVEILFQQIRMLKAKNVAVIFITHRLEEIFQIADEITVIRDGKWISHGPVTGYTVDKLVSHMVGRDINDHFPKDCTVPIGETVLEVKQLTQDSKHGGRFKNISFNLKKGEILGFAGLIGAGRSELMRAIFGLDPLTSGEIFLNGKRLKIRHPNDAVKEGIALVSEDRKTYGLVLKRNVHENISLVNLKKFVKRFFIDDKNIDKEAQDMKELLQIKVSDFKVNMGTLSGGNQQKVVLAKWIIGNVKIIILDEPTRGIDVGAKAEIHRLMCKFAREGMSIIMISSELPEVLGMSDRVIVMNNGQITGTLARPDFSQEKIMKLATSEV
ncbi:MAG TPA: D-xylose ABC transporter ATP-binding protein [Lachnospiraceae bacterium]|nr:D-xylose ABC transporter ATP-binding protein [Lachnospiraceae bacterium]HBR02586.1 D-xylose ABC transporter ATP-binding protein [Ruminiclostridium sp.]